jgi:NADP-dependent aldehyde dehydrogenase
MSLQGASIVGLDCVRGDGPEAFGTNPSTGEQMQPAYAAVTIELTNEAVAKAAAAFPVYRKLSGALRGGFLRAIAAKIEAAGDALAERGPLETGLPEGRFRMETGRTCNQLRLFATIIEDGSWVDARIDAAQPDRQPIPKPDVRSMLQPIGPVAVFCASNFPLAFSVAGGDTASALAAGCPVVVKAHHSHPGVAEMVGLAVQAAAKETGMPDGVFSMLYGSGRTVGAALVQHPDIRAVGFTGSHAGGRALMDLAAARPQPIPVYAEMGSLNPVFVLPGAMTDRGESIAEGLSGSVTLGAGQFCTCPGMVVAASNDATEQFTDQLALRQREASPAVMLNTSIHEAYQKGTAALDQHLGVEGIASASTQNSGCQGDPALYITKAEDFIGDEALAAEVFGPSTLLVTHNTREQLLQLAAQLEGHLTATVHATDADLAEYGDLLDILETKVGRLVINGYPTGVEVCHAMVHGGPYPATSDGRSTSVGTQAIFRFARALAYQGYPDAILPDALKNDNPLGIWRMVDGERAK